MNKGKTCCFIGHREVENRADIEREVYKVIERLIEDEGVTRFLLGSKSKFNDLCSAALCKVKEIHPEITRIYVRAEYPIINEDYRRYLLQFYDDTYYPQQISGAGRAVYVKRNIEMITKSDVCVFYYNERSAARGTRIAYEYAAKKRKRIINTFALSVNQFFDFSDD